MASCHLCGTPLTDAPVVGTQDRHGHGSRRVACGVCSLVQQCPMPTMGEMDAYYASHQYRQDYAGTGLILTDATGRQRAVSPGHPDFDAAWSRMHEARAEWALEEAGFVPGMRVLDVGCGRGFAAAHMAARGAEVTGIEPDVTAAQEAAGRLPDTAKVHAGRMQDVDPAGPFDIVTAFHVLEHVHQPIDMLRLWRSWLTPRGALCIEVPDILHPNPPLEGNHFQRVHLYEFSKHTLAACLVRAGFEPIEIVEVRQVLRAYCRPAAEPHNVSIPHGGDYVRGYLDRVRAEHAA